MMRKAVAVGLAAVMAVSVMVSNGRPAEARGGAGIAVGVAAAVIGGALLYGALRPRARYAYYPRRPVYYSAGYYTPRYYYAPRRVVVVRKVRPRHVAYRNWRRW